MIGIALDGTSVLSCYGGATYGRCTDYATSATAVEGDTFSQCGGHGNPYHYHQAPVCMLQQLGTRSDALVPARREILEALVQVEDSLTAVFAPKALAASFLRTAAAR